MIGILVEGKPTIVCQKPLEAWNHARTLKTSATTHVAFVFALSQGYVNSESFTYKPHRFVEFSDWYREKASRYEQ